MTTPSGLYIAKSDGFWWNGLYQGSSWRDFVLGTTEPTALNTGPRLGRVAKTVVNGDVTVTTNGAEVKDLDIYGRIFVRANDVYIHDCIVRGRDKGTTDGGLIDCLTGTLRTVIEYCELAQTVAPWFWYDGVKGHDYTARYCHIHDTVDGFGVFNTQNSNGPANVTVEGNYVHDLTYIYRNAAMANVSTGDGLGPKEPHSDDHTHNDGIQIQGNSNISVVGNAFWGKCSTTTGNGYLTPSGYGTPNGNTGTTRYDPYYPNNTGQCITGSPNSPMGPISNTTIDKNWLYGASRQIVFIKNGFANSNIGSITNNRFDSSQESSTSIQLDTGLTATVSGNVTMGTGATVNVVYV